MCWSKSASIVLSGIGVANVAIATYRRSAAPFIVCAAYFALLEGVQALGYFYIDDCAGTTNQILMRFSYLLVAFQPIVFNFLYMHFIPHGVRERIQVWVYGACIVAIWVMIMKSYEFTGVATCGIEAFCSNRTCISTGQYHLRWEVVLNALFPLNWTYIFAVLLLPTLYGSWRLVIYTMIMPSIVYIFITSHQNEWPAVWCLVAAAICLIPVFYAHLFRVNSWPLWPKHWLESDR